MKRLLLLAIPLVLLGIAACGSAEPTATPTATPTPTVVPTPTAMPTPTATLMPEPTPAFSYQVVGCAIEVPLGQALECGTLTVPEDRAQPDGPTIQVHVARFRSEGPGRAPDPVVYLAGGPGENAIESLPFSFEDLVAPFLERRDVIVVDQRGVGLSNPALDCPEYVEFSYDTLDQDLSVEEGVVLSNATLFACHDRLTAEGVNFAAYHSAANAADLNDLRQALGYDEWNLFGVSYGTRLALTMMRDVPQGIRSVVLDSAYPPQVDLYSAIPANADRAFSTLFAGCAADLACAAAYPELKPSLFQTVDTLNRAPVTIPITNPLTGETFDALIKGNDLVGFLFQSLYSAEIIPLLPEVISDVEAGVYDMLGLLLGGFLANLDFASVAMQLAVQCGEEVAFSSPEKVSAAAEPFPYLRELIQGGASLGSPIFTLCAEWGAREAGPIENEAVMSAIPTLVLAGEYDPITPPSWGQAAAADLSNSHFFEFPGIGHGVSISDECPLRITLAFLDDPTLEPDSSCIAEMDGPAFLLPQTELSLVLFEDAAVFGIRGVRPEGWVEQLPGTYSRSAIRAITLVQQAAPGLTASFLLELLSAQLELSEALEQQSTHQSWALYQAETQGLTFDIAVVERVGGTSMVLLTGTRSKRDFYFTQAFLPALEAFEVIAP